MTVEVMPPPAWIVSRVGDRRGKRTLIEAVGQIKKAPGRYQMVMRLECDCGRVDEVRAASLSSVGERCRDCAREVVRKRHKGRSNSLAGNVGSRMLGLAGGAPLVDRDERRAFARAAREERGADWWREDGAEQRIAESAIAREMGRLSFEELAAIFGVSRERIRQIEAEALEKLRGEIKREEWRAAARRTG